VWYQEAVAKKLATTWHYHTKIKNITLKASGFPLQHPREECK
jgi:hypothetical protein